MVTNMPLKASIWDARTCELGEGPLWHPERQQLFWFDIMGKKLLSREGDTALEWSFDEHVSAAGWIDHDRLLIASETGLWRFDITTGQRHLLHPLEADKPDTRSNDGRADPQGGFWIGTMGKAAEPEAGAIYRFFKGELRRLCERVTIPNAICFAPDGRVAYYCDTALARIMRQPLDAAGWPVDASMGEPEVFIDFGPEGLYPDGAVCDADGALWIAQWGAGRVARYLPDGRFDRVISVAGRQSTCPAFGGKDLSELYITTARQDLSDPGPQDGCVYHLATEFAGCPADRVLME